MSDDVTLKVSYYIVSPDGKRSGPSTAYVTITAHGARGTNKYSDEPVELTWNAERRCWEEIL